jgi:hypothetical protein
MIDYAVPLHSCKYRWLRAPATKDTCKERSSDSDDLFAPTRRALMPQFAVEFHPLAADEAEAAERWYREQTTRDTSQASCPRQPGL